MTTEQAILQLSSKAQYAMQKADSAPRQMQARLFVDITNRIIDYYNETEPLRQQLRNMQDIVRVLCEYIGIRQDDIDSLQHIPAKFIRSRIIYRLPEHNSECWLFHKVCTDYSMLVELQGSVQVIRQELMPIADAGVLPNLTKTASEMEEIIDDFLMTY